MEYFTLSERYAAWRLQTRDRRGGMLVQTAWYSQETGPIAHGSCLCERIEGDAASRKKEGGHKRRDTAQENGRGGIAIRGVTPKVGPSDHHGETPQEAAAQIMEALNYLKVEAERFGLSDLADVIRKAASKAAGEAQPDR